MNTIPPSHMGRTPEEIVSTEVHLDSVGYMYRAMSWLDYAKRTSIFPASFYAAIEGRLGIEYLLFEELVISTGANLSRSDYARCVKEGNLKKTLDRVSPDYERLQEFAQVVISVEPQAPRLVKWDLGQLMKIWGKLSEYLHWCGAKTETTEDPTWAKYALSEIEASLFFIWEKMTTGQSGILHPAQMHPEVRELWEQFKYGEISVETVKFRLDYLRPELRAKYALQGTIADSAKS